METLLLLAAINVAHKELNRLHQNLTPMYKSIQDVAIWDDEVLETEEEG